MKINILTLEFSFPEQNHHAIVKYNSSTGKTTVTGDLFPSEQELLSKIVNGLQRDARAANWKQNTKVVKNERMARQSETDRAESD